MTALLPSNYDKNAITASIRSVFILSVPSGRRGDSRLWLTPGSDRGVVSVNDAESGHSLITPGPGPRESENCPVYSPQPLGSERGTLGTVGTQTVSPRSGQPAGMWRRTGGGGIAT